MAAPGGKPWNLAQSNGVLTKAINAVGFGLPHPNYNPSVHGPYHPGRFYGKPDTKLGDVALKDLPAWLGRRSKNPIDMYRAVNRASWRWWTNYMEARRPGVAGLTQFIVTLSAFYYFLQYKSHTDERNAKYH